MDLLQSQDFQILVGVAVALLAVGAAVVFLKSSRSPKMYPQGRMSHHFCEMRVGDYLSVKGPKGRFRYQPGQVRAFGMLAGGSGINPMFQIAGAILENPKDKAKVNHIYANVTQENILLKPPEVWNDGVVFVSKDMIQTRWPAPGLDIQVRSTTDEQSHGSSSRIPRIFT